MRAGSSDPVPPDEATTEAFATAVGAAPAGGWKTLVAAPVGGSDGRRPPASRTIIVRLALGLVAVLIAVGLLAAWAAQWLAEREAVNDAATTTDVLADAVIQPHLSAALLEGEPDAIDEFDRVVREQVLSADVVRVKIWSPEGEVLYADEVQLIGRTFELDEEQREALARPSTRASISDLSEEENVFESGSRLLEVYRPVWAPDGQQLLFEVYLPYEPVAARSADLWRGFAGVTTSSLLLLIVLTAPIVWGLLRRLSAEDSRRADLLQHAVDASDAERRRIAGTLHDGPVQELVATSFAAESAADASARAGEEGAAARLRDVAASVRGNVRVLRSLLMDIYPPGLAAAGLAHALQDLAATARSRSADVELDLATPAPDLSEADEQLVYRVAQEALRNAVTHAVPCRVRIRLRTEGDDAILDVVDDGPGFDPGVLDAVPVGGHLGTAVLRDLAQQGAAELAVATAPGAGVHWKLRLPSLSSRKARP